MGCLRVMKTAPCQGRRIIAIQASTSASASVHQRISYTTSWRQLGQPHLVVVGVITDGHEIVLVSACR